ncbi:MAG: hypothetical protein KGY48_13415 [Wenzhouxiangellaceae bacterium]|jgi:hypothetical protein|nr:hypothetical protein [Wenzhouxiangellaceae bacterium]MBS3824896.1 hypothetical protein [Wenzhouxiangellaceae bacterium]
MKPKQGNAAPVAGGLIAALSVWVSIADASAQPESSISHWPIGTATPGTAISTA